MIKKICLVIPSLHAGGMERVMSELASYFCFKPLIEVHVVMYGMKPDIFYPFPDNIIIHKPSFIFNNRKRLWYSIKNLFFLRRKIKQIQPDSILSFGEYWNSFVLLALFGLEFPIYVSDRCQPDKHLVKFHNLLRKFLYPRATGIIVQTMIAKKIYQWMLPKANLSVIGNPIRKISTEQKANKENIVLSVGRLIKSKHHDDLIRLFVKINMPGWKLIIIGGDALKQQNMMKLRVLIKELNAEKKIILTDFRNDVDEFYNKSKIFAFTSSSEGFPNVIGEAMSAGLPVVAFNCIAGPAEMIEDGVTGYLIPLFEYNTFEERLKLLMKDEQLQQTMGFNGRKKIAAFSSEIIGEKFYQTLLSDL